MLSKTDGVLSYWRFQASEIAVIIKSDSIFQLVHLKFLSKYLGSSFFFPKNLLGPFT